MSGRHDDRDRTIALAGVFQAAQLVTALARNGQCEQAALQSSIESLFQFTPDSVEAVYGGIAGLETGLSTLIMQIDQPARRDLEVARYVISLITHGDKLLKDRPRFEALGKDLEILEQKTRHFDLADYSRTAHLARLYQQYISPVQPQIMVRGEPLYLQNPQIAEQIRSILLAGIRAAVLWRQCGGRRWQLIMRRRKTMEIAQDLLEP